MSRTIVSHGALLDGFSDPSDWSMEVPNIIKQRISQLTSEIQGLSSHLDHLEQTLARKVAKNEVLPLFSFKLDRHIGEKLENDVRTTLSAIRTNLNDVQTNLDRDLAGLRKNVKQTANAVCITDEFKKSLETLETRAGELQSEVNGVQEQAAKNYELFKSEREKVIIQQDNVGKEVAQMQSVIARLQSTLDERSKIHEKERADISGELSKVGALVYDARSAIDEIQSTIPENITQARLGLEAYARDLMNQERQRHQAETKTSTTMLEDLARRIEGSESSVSLLNAQIDAMETTLRAEVGRQIADAKSAVMVALDRALEKFQSLKDTLDNSVAEQQQVIKRMRAFEQQFDQADVLWKTAMSRLEEETKKTVDKLEAQVDQALSQVANNLEEGERKVIDITNLLHSCTDEWSEKWNEREKVVDDTLKRLSKLSTQIDSAVLQEKKTRAEEIAALKSRLKDVQESLNSEIAKKASEEDTRRALWAKVDKIDRVQIQQNIQNITQAEMNLITQDPEIDLGYTDNNISNVINNRDEKPKFSTININTNLTTINTTNYETQNNQDTRTYNSIQNMSEALQTTNVKTLTPETITEHSQQNYSIGDTISVGTPFYNNGSNQISLGNTDVLAKSSSARQLRPQSQSNNTPTTPKIGKANNFNKNRLSANNKY